VGAPAIPYAGRTIVALPHDHFLDPTHGGDAVPDDGPREMKFDVRAYAYRGEILLLGARVYQGRSPTCAARATDSRRSASREIQGRDAS